MALVGALIVALLAVGLGFRRLVGGALKQRAEKRSLRVVDVADDDDLISTYGPRLPVLGFAGRELDWPFGATDVLRWIRKLEQT